MELIFQGLRPKSAPILPAAIKQPQGITFSATHWRRSCPYRTSRRRVTFAVSGPHVRQLVALPGRGAQSLLGYGGKTSDSLSTAMFLAGTGAASTRQGRRLCSARSVSFESDLMVGCRCASAADDALPQFARLAVVTSRALM